jgi:two-component system response regulator AtoC
VHEEIVHDVLDPRIARTGPDAISGISHGPRSRNELRIRGRRAALAAALASHDPMPTPLHAMNPPKAPPPTLTETRALVRRGLYLITVQKDGMRAVRLRNDRPLTAGRSDECDVKLDTPLLSRVHFSIASGSPVCIRDHRSSNGTKVNGHPLAPDVPTPLEVGNLVEAGGVFFVLKDHVPEEADLAPEGALRGASASPSPLSGVVVADPSMQRLHELVELVARSTISVLITGETGAGKEVISDAVHARSPRAAQPFVSLNCAALPETLLESELFGYERGAFTGATQAKQGLIESAHEGTLFLDEIGEMPMATQAKLLRVLENGELTRIGALKPRVVDVRFIAATNRDLPTLVGRGQFRRDLYFRLNGITIPVPPLRERPSEIAPLAMHFLELAAKRAGRRAPRLAPEVFGLLAAHPWPGNIRELRNVMDRAVALCAGDVLGPVNVLLDPPMPSSTRGPLTASVTPIASAAPMIPAPGQERAGRLLRLDAGTERKLIEEALERAAGNQGRAAELLGVSRRTLINRLDEYGIARPRKRSGPAD